MSSRWQAELTVARALAQAYLATEWRVGPLTAVGQSTLGRRSHWLRLLAAEMLAGHPEPPVDAPRALADAVQASDVFQRAVSRAAGRHRPLRVVHRVESRTRMAAARWPVPVLHDQGQLAAWLELSPGQLLWLADPRGQQLRTGPGALHGYSYTWSARSGRAPRLLEAPRPILKRVHRQLLHELLGPIPAHPAAHGFVPGRSVLTHARLHLGASVVVTLDVADFFARISPGRVFGILRTAGYPEPVAHTLAGLCTTRTPGWVLRAMPPGGSDGDRYVLRARLRAPHLPQGAPTSPALANLACFHLDRRLHGLAGSFEATYSRYADDLTFSADAPLALATDRLVKAATSIAVDEGLPLNPGKTRVQRHSGRQLVTGVVVNERLNVPRQDYDQLRAALHEAWTRGPEVANRDGHPDFRSHLTGRVEWVAAVNPARARRLQAELAAIVWPPGA